MTHFHVVKIYVCMLLSCHFLFHYLTRVCMHTFRWRYQCGVRDQAVMDEVLVRVVTVRVEVPVAADELLVRVVRVPVACWYVRRVVVEITVTW